MCAAPFFCLFSGLAVGLQARDPIPQFRQYLLDNKLASEADIEAWEKEVCLARCWLMHFQSL